MSGKGVIGVEDSSEVEVSLVGDIWDLFLRIEGLISSSPDLFKWAVILIHIYKGLPNCFVHDLCIVGVTSERVVYQRKITNAILSTIQNAQHQGCAVHRMYYVRTNGVSSFCFVNN